MTLVYCNPTSKALAEAIKKLPLLEELHLIISTTMDPIDCETIGISCPMLASFTCTSCWCLDVEFSCQAVAIGNRLSEYFQSGKEGLDPILKGCLHLEVVILFCKGIQAKDVLSK
ncbi:hypothetical protein SASPL_130140 [Salvia splendens]|uniref:Uncharacterized protein n=1 Tax=Salvia splendens TaxID=180675 RepID=A0A8X8ZJM3_SALSN|nr:hypothetical protein SASPL_130140 [Salvia splendens]